MCQNRVYALMTLNRRDFRNCPGANSLALHSGAGVALHSTHREEGIEMSKGYRTEIGKGGETQQLADKDGTALTRDFGLPLSDNEDSLKAG